MSFVPNNWNVITCADTLLKDKNRRTFYEEAMHWKITMTNSNVGVCAINGEKAKQQQQQYEDQNESCACVPK